MGAVVIGGARQGAGRKKVGDRHTVSLPAEVVEYLRALSGKPPAEGKRDARLAAGIIEAVRRLTATGPGVSSDV